MTTTAPLLPGLELPRPAPITVVAIDPSKLTGLAMVTCASNGMLLVRDLCVLSLADTWEEAPQSALAIFRAAMLLPQLVTDVDDFTVAIEMPFGAAHGNLGSYGAQMLLVGGVLALLADQQIPHVRIMPRQAKAATVGNHVATKADVIEAVKNLPGVAECLDWKRKPYREAQCDAISIAIAAIGVVTKRSAPKRGRAARGVAK